MSYCSDVKNELGQLRLSPCCRYAFAYGLMLFGRAFSAARISMQTTNPEMAALYAKTLEGLFGVKATLACGGSKRPTYKAEVLSAGDRLKILACFDYGITEDVICEELVQKDCCAASFLRGAFLACGNILDPDLEYRAEFAVHSGALANEMGGFLAAHGLRFKKSTRGRGYVLYTKDSTQIEDFLTLIGAPRRTLDMMNTKIIKSVKNKINRANNCDNANISKTVEASYRQRKAIEYLEQNDRLYSLPQELINAALLRKNNPDAPLKELCNLSEERLTVSGLNHRLTKLVEIAEDSADHE